MATIKHVEDINVYQDSMGLVTKFFKLAYTNNNFKKEFSLTDQLKRCVVSIPSNISEGFERDTKKEFIRFLYISKGSCSEFKTQITICKNLNLITEEEYKGLFSEADKILKQLGSFIKYLKNSKLAS
ncbi:four helix bundle protein [Patescibacteria group bacterium]|nr:four helix bundle protein [Patescibacteria group bacterium]